MWLLGRIGSLFLLGIIFITSVSAAEAELQKCNFFGKCKTEQVLPSIGDCQFIAQHDKNYRCKTVIDKNSKPSVTVIVSQPDGVQGEGIYPQNPSWMYTH